VLAGAVLMAYGLFALVRDALRWRRYHRWSSIARQ
jgi:hypothetical protein